MRITVASGKGGTGKTTIATSLALSLAERPGDGAKPLFLDCDVEAPNALIFLGPVLEHREEVSILIPEVDETRCNHCGRCAEVCQWHAIAVVGKKVLVFPQLCHGCGSCTLACPEDAIAEIPNPIGVIDSGPARSGITFAQGVLDIGEPMAVPIISQLKKHSTDYHPELVDPEPVCGASPPAVAPPGARGSVSGADEGRLTIIDASPGTACPVVEAMRGADFVLLVTEPTPFGLHDLHLAIQVTWELGIPAGVVINRDGVGDSGVDEYCQEAELPVLMRIPLDQQIAEGIARGKPLIHIKPEYVQQFQDLYAQIVAIVEENR